MIDFFTSLLESLSANPLAAAILIILATFVLEDAATISASMLAVAGVVDPWVALTALYIGIVAGDAGLYGLGRVAKATGWLSRFVNDRDLVKGRKWLRRRFIPAIIGARFTPGMRVPTFVASGFLGISFWRFFGTIAACAAVWTTGLFAVIYLFGDLFARAIGSNVWMLGVAVLAAAVILPYFLRSRSERQAREAAGE